MNNPEPRITDIIDRRDRLIDAMYSAHLRCGDVPAAELVDIRKMGIKIGEC